MNLLGYVGPGAGLSMIGALAAVVCVLLLAALAPILYPLRLLLCWLRTRTTAATTRHGADSPASPGPATDAASP